jgi:hypothetical protein
MTPADQATEKLLTPFSVRRRERGGRSVAAHIASDPEAKAFIDDWAPPN